RGAEAALQGVARHEGLLQVADGPALADALDGLHAAAIGLHGQREAAAHHLAIELHGAGAAHAVFTAEVAALEAEVFAQEVDEVRARLDAALPCLSVHAHLDGVEIGHGWARGSQVRAEASRRCSSTPARWRLVSGLWVRSGKGSISARRLATAVASVASSGARPSIRASVARARQGVVATPMKARRGARNRPPSR